MRAALAAVLLAAAAPLRAAVPDPFRWLEPTVSTQAVSWAQAQSRSAEERLKAAPVYPSMEEDLREVLLAPDRLPEPTPRGGYVYNFWQDAAHPRGLWRRATPAEYAKDSPDWEVLLDLDALAASEGENWVWEGADCLPPDGDRCMVSLSRGGRDAAVEREFYIPAGGFVADGFTLPETKSQTAWVDKDALLVATDFGPGTLTSSGYPRLVKLWTRGEPLSAAKTVYEGPASDVGDWPDAEIRPEGASYFIERSPSFFTEEIFRVAPGGALRGKLPLPEDADFKGVFQGRVLASLRSDWRAGGRTFPSGSLVSIPLDAASDTAAVAGADLVFDPGARGALVSVSGAKTRLYVNTLDDVNGKVLKLARLSSGWVAQPLDLPEHGTTVLAAEDPFQDLAFGRYENFLTPPTIYSWDGTLPGDLLTPVKSLPPRFDAGPYVAEQLHARSADGTEVPYFLVHRSGMKRDGKTPTLLYGYGGFEVPLTPRYLETLGKAWLGRGGAYALANIRGGGEFGPRWHQAAVGAHRQKAFDDFEAVARDLERRRVASPRTLGIMGGSNGGLLVGTVLVQTPRLFGAVVCEVPLLDMLRYTKLGAGASWIAEYGDPADPRMAKALAAYSPYENVKPGVRYPPVFFLSSTEDDRVEPAHARKMAAKMEAYGDDVLYYENSEGGHGAAANIEERVKERALEYTFLWETLSRGRAPSTH